MCRVRRDRERGANTHRGTRRTDRPPRAAAAGQGRRVRRGPRARGRVLGGVRDGGARSTPQAPRAECVGPGASTCPWPRPSRLRPSRLRRECCETRAKRHAPRMGRRRRRQHPADRCSRPRAAETCAACRRLPQTAAAAPARPRQSRCTDDRSACMRRYVRCQQHRAGERRGAEMNGDGDGRRQERGPTRERTQAPRPRPRRAAVRQSCCQTRRSPHRQAREWP